MVGVPRDTHGAALIDQIIAAARARDRAIAPMPNASAASANVAAHSGCDADRIGKESMPA